VLHGNTSGDQQFDIGWKQEVILDGAYLEFLVLRNIIVK
jgi:hypothetical protein